MIGFPTNDFVALLPIAILTVGALAVLLSEVFLVSGRRGYQAAITVVFAVAAGAAAVARPVSGYVFNRQAVADDFSAFVTVVVCAGLALSALVGAELEDVDEGRAGAQGESGGPPDAASSRDLENEGRAGKGINQAGYLKDKDKPGSDRDKP